MPEGMTMPESTRPENGSQPSITPNPSIRKIAQRKAGIDSMQTTSTSRIFSMIVPRVP